MIALADAFDASGSPQLGAIVESALDDVLTSLSRYEKSSQPTSPVLDPLGEMGSAAALLTDQVNALATSLIYQMFLLRGFIGAGRVPRQVNDDVLQVSAQLGPAAAKVVADEGAAAMAAETVQGRLTAVTPSFLGGRGRTIPFVAGAAALTARAVPWAVNLVRTRNANEANVPASRYARAILANRMMPSTVEALATGGALRRLERMKADELTDIPIPDDIEGILPDFKAPADGREVLTAREARALLQRMGAYESFNTSMDTYIMTRETTRKAPLGGVLSSLAGPAGSRFERLLDDAIQTIRPGGLIYASNLQLMQAASNVSQAMRVGLAIHLLRTTRNARMGEKLLEQGLLSWRQSNWPKWFPQTGVLYANTKYQSIHQVVQAWTGRTSDVFRAWRLQHRFMNEVLPNLYDMAFGEDDLPPKDKIEQRKAYRQLERLLNASRPEWTKSYTYVTSRPYTEERRAQIKEATGQEAPQGHAVRITARGVTPETTLIVELFGRISRGLMYAGLDALGVIEGPNPELEVNGLLGQTLDATTAVATYALDEMTPIAKDLGTAILNEKGADLRFVVPENEGFYRALAEIGAIDMKPGEDGATRYVPMLAYYDDEVDSGIVAPFHTVDRVIEKNLLGAYNYVRDATFMVTTVADAVAGRPVSEEGLAVLRYLLQDVPGAREVVEKTAQGNKLMVPPDSEAGMFRRLRTYFMASGTTEPLFGRVLIRDYDIKKRRERAEKLLFPVLEAIMKEIESGLALETNPLRPPETPDQED